MASTLRAVLGKRIRDLRRKRGWRQIDLTAHAELSKTHICEIETAKREIGLEALKRIADALESSLSELLKGI
jgi:transcriptional regulator with XRE-family HTH domain